MENSLDHYLDEFWPEIKDFYGNNIVIGGSHALQLHGLSLGREPDDLDVIIYRPRSHQLNYLSTRGAGFEAHRNYPEKDDINIVKDPSDIRSYKRKANGLTLNVLLDDRPVPTDVLLYDYDRRNIHLKINNIRTIIEAKSNYVFGEDGCYMRRKDAEHLTLLKNHNFNLYYDPRAVLAI